MITDQGSSISTSEVIQQLYQLLNITKDKISAYHPQSNLTERSNKTIKAVLSKLVHDCPEKWPQYLPIALFSYNNTVNKSTSFSPGYLFFGRQLRNAHDIYFGTTSSKFFRDQSHYACDLYSQFREVYGLVTESLQKQQLRAKKVYDKKANRTQYSIGDHVAIFFPLPVSERANNKFKTRLRVLFRIDKVISDHNLLVTNLQTGKQKVVHHDLLRFIEPTLAQKLIKKLKISDGSEPAGGSQVTKSQLQQLPFNNPNQPSSSGHVQNSNGSSSDDENDLLLDFDLDNIGHMLPNRSPARIAHDPVNIRPPIPAAYDDNDQANDIHVQNAQRHGRQMADEDEIVIQPVGPAPVARPRRIRRLPAYLRDYATG